MSNDVKNWLNIVRSLANENGPVRICLSSNPIEEGGRSAMVRVLALGADGVAVIQEPGIRDLGTRVRPGTDVDILAIQNQTRLVGGCRVTGQIKYALNKTLKVDALQLSPPKKVHSGQLRDFYRVPIGAGVAVAPVVLQLDPDDAPTIRRASLASLDPERERKTRLVNVSGGGMGLAIVVDESGVAVFEVNDVCVIHAELPTLDKPLDLKGRIVHTEKLENGDLYLGLSFVFDDPAAQKQVEDQLQKLSVWLQRRMLQKKHLD
jgi:c-di-GMP-binding flagellar brake protein YcgR